MLTFELVHESSRSRARRARLVTPHGPVETPAFMPVGTKGAVKGLNPRQVADSGTEIVLANTYHLMLRPGEQLIGSWGGLHRFMGWDRAILTDSGGYQVFSLARLAKIDDDGVTFQSHIDGAKLHLDARSAMRVQNLLGADIIMAFDQCAPYPCERSEVETAVRRTIAWAKQCVQDHAREDQALFGIVQGGLCPDLRRQCAEELCALNFAGMAIGGLSVGESPEQMLEVLEDLPDYLPRDKPRYLMGVGMPRDIVQSVLRGVDMFDCVLPTRNGRNAYAFTAHGPVKLRNERYKEDRGPIEPGCGCEACSRFSRGYIRHLFIVEEMLGPILTSIHNICFYQRLMQRIRALIEDDKLHLIQEEFPVVGPMDVPGRGD